jgi:hypothetical protein
MEYLFDDDPIASKLGGKRQKSSGALIFPVTQEQKSLRETRIAIEKELEELRELKKELKEYIDK